MSILLFAGAGTSAELGVPAMTGMAEEFLQHAEQWDVDPVLVKQLIGTTLDIEHLIEELDRICTARPSLEAIGHQTDSLVRVDKIRAEVEWFVQHVAERVLASHARLMWGSLLNVAARRSLTFVTTNYDRAIELAANSEGVHLDDGFGRFEQTERAEWRGFGHLGDAHPLIKLHGSTDWYSDSHSLRPIKLRHPMPLFGRAELRFASGEQLGSALVLPSREKLLTRDPYPRLSQAFLNAADQCDAAVFVGTSLRDHHIRSAVAAMVSRVPVFVVSRRGDDHGISGVTAIAQHASTFLVSTLPDAMLSADPISMLHRARPIPESIFPALRDALDTSVVPETRRNALEQLDNEGVALAPHLLKALLRDADATVARYALGLIPQSAVSSELLAAAADSPHATEIAYGQDLDLLRGMVAGASAPGS